MNFIKTEEKEKVLNNICSYIRNNSKCKLPWNMGEIEKALEIVKRLLLKF